MTRFHTITVPRRRPKDSAGLLNDGFHVYALCDPRVNEIRYVGVTRLPLDVRLYEHVYESPRQTRRWAWNKSLKNDGVIPTIRLLEEAYDEDTMFLLEQEWIYSLREMGADLVNGTDGGDRPPRPPIGNQRGVGPRGPSPLRGRPMTEESKAKMRGPRPERRGIPWSDERRANHDAKVAKKTECKNGHDLTDPANLGFVKNNKGYLSGPEFYIKCLACIREREQSERDAKKNTTATS